MEKFFTGLGDSGYTNLVRSGHIKKSSKIIEAIGNIDELNSVIGVVIVNLAADRIAKTLKSIQNSLFIIGAELAYSKTGVKPNRSISAVDIKNLEDSIEELGAAIKLNKFVLPGGSIGSSYLHLARAVCRRAERSVIALGELEKNKYIIGYMNRLSSYLFVAALYVNKLEGIDESSPSY